MKTFLFLGLWLGGVLLVPVAWGVTGSSLQSTSMSLQSDPILKGLFSNASERKRPRVLNSAAEPVSAKQEAPKEAISQALSSTDSSIEAIQAPEPGFTVMGETNQPSDKPIVFPKHVAFSKHYELNATNYISSHEVNTVQLPSAILRVIQPPEQQAKETAALVCDSSAGCHKHYLLYDHDNTTFSFGFTDPHFKSVQFTVFLANHHTVSLHFSLADIKGDVVQVSQKIAGPATPDAKPSLDSLSDYDQALIQETKEAFSLLASQEKVDSEDASWVLLHRDTHEHPLFAELTQRDYRVYQPDAVYGADNSHIIRVRQFCNVSQRYLKLNTRALVDGLSGIQRQLSSNGSRHSSHLLAATLSASSVLPGECVWLVTISETGSQERGQG